MYVYLSFEFYYSKIVKKKENQLKLIISEMSAKFCNKKQEVKVKTKSWMYFIITKLLCHVPCLKIKVNLEQLKEINPQSKLL